VRERRAAVVTNGHEKRKEKRKKKKMKEKSIFHEKW
jgi:hypothetical protein